MMFDAVTRLAIAELIIYIFILPLLVYILFRHFKYGFFGWGFLVAFGLLRIVSSALQIDKQHKESEGKPTDYTADIVNSVGVSALLLAISGIIHEAAAYIPGHSNRLAWTIKLLLHMAIVSGTALAAVGAASFTRPPGPSNNYADDLHLLEAGYVLLLLALLSLFAFAIYAALRLSRDGFAGRPGAGPLLLARVTLLALCFVAARVIYGFVYAFGHYPKLSPISGIFVVKFVLIFLVQLLAMLCLVVGGLMFKVGKAVPSNA